MIVVFKPVLQRIEIILIHDPAIWDPTHYHLLNSLIGRKTFTRSQEKLREGYTLIREQSKDKLYILLDVD